MFLSNEAKVVPCTVAVNALRHVIESNTTEELVRSLDQQEVWQRIQDEEKYWQGYIILARLVLANLTILLLCNEYFCVIYSFGNTRPSTARQLG